MPLCHKKDADIVLLLIPVPVLSGIVEVVVDTSAILTVFVAVWVR